jgi:hypothetical protein
MRLTFGSLALVASLAGSLGCSEGDFELGPCGKPWPAEANGYCGGTTRELIAAAGDPVAPAEPLTEQAVEGSACNAVERSFPLEIEEHLPPCSPVEHQTNPPSSGMHYGLFPAFGSFEQPIPRGFAVHGLEHGGVTIGYSCAARADEVARAKDLVSALEVSPLCCSTDGCPSSATNQLLLTPDPGLGSAWAAASWGFTLTADCFEPEVFEAFAEAHRNQAPERICSNGAATDVTRPAP